MDAFLTDNHGREDGLFRRSDRPRDHEADALCIPLSEQSLPLRSLSAPKGLCERKECFECRRKLKEAMRANRAWETRFNDLHRESQTYTRELERQLQERFDGDNSRDQLLLSQSSCDSADSLGLVQELERQLQEERRRSSAMKRRLELLESELSLLTSKDEARRNSSVKELEEMALIHEQLQIFQEDFEREKEDRQRLEAEKEDLRRKMVLAQQQASTNQANFLAARRQKEELIHKLRRLTS